MQEDARDGYRERLPSCGPGVAAGAVTSPVPAAMPITWIMGSSALSTRPVDSPDDDMRSKRSLNIGKYRNSHDARRL